MTDFVAILIIGASSIWSVIKTSTDFRLLFLKKLIKFGIKRNTYVVNVGHNNKLNKIKELLVVTDNIADMLTRIRNANMVKHQIVEIPATKMSKAIAKILKEEGFIENFEIYSENLYHYLLLSLKYKGQSRERVISNITRISKPGLRFYAKSQKLPKVLNGLGIAILSTSKGVMTNTKAKELGIGGEVLCYIW